MSQPDERKRIKPTRSGKSPSSTGEHDEAKSDKHMLFWTAFGAVATAVASVIAWLALSKPDLPVVVNQNNNSQLNPVSVTNFNHTTIVYPSLPSNSVPTNAPAPEPARKRFAMTDAEQQLFEQAQQEGEIKLLLAPFLITSDPAKKPSYAMLRPMLQPDPAGLDKIYLYLRQTNSAGGPWIAAAPPRTFYRGVAPGTIVTDWSDGEPTKQLLTERQQVLLKFIPVLLKAGELGP